MKLRDKSVVKGSLLLTNKFCLLFEKHVSSSSNKHSQYIYIYIYIYKYVAYICNMPCLYIYIYIYK